MAVDEDLTLASNVSPLLVQEANRVLLSQQPDLPMSTRHLALAIGLYESGYGRNPPWLYTDPATGVPRPSYNWGATITGSPPYVYLHNAQTDKWYKFSVFDTAEAGFNYFFGAWKKPNTLAAAATGDSSQVAQAMYANHYFEGNASRKPHPEQSIIDYARNMTWFAAIVAKALGEPITVTQSKKSATGTDVPA
jgi:hypothetical protein